MRNVIDWRMTWSVAVGVLLAGVLVAVVSKVL